MSPTPRWSPATCVPTVIGGGEWVVSYPARCRLECHIEYLPDQADERGRGSRVAREFEDWISRAAAADPWLREHPPRVVWLSSDVPPAEVSPEEPIVEALLGVERDLGRPGRLGGLDNWHDGATLIVEAGIPAVCYGPGDIHLAHTADEHVPVADLVACAQGIALAALLQSHVTPANPFVGQMLRVPRLSDADAVAVASEAFGVDGRAEEIGSHQDQNFRIDAPDGRYVLKVANPAFTLTELEMQNRAMEHVAISLPTAVPTPVSARDGADVVQIERAGRRYGVRLLGYLEGEPLRAFGHLAPDTLREAGRLAARVAAALASFDHPAADRTLQWDVQYAGDVIGAFAPEVRDGRRRALLERTVERATDALEDLGSALRRQVIHGDVTDWNVVARRNRAAQPSPCGLIDFGDMTRSWLAAECAVLAAAVCARRPARALQDATEVVRGFHATMPLLSEEIAALPVLMAARGALSAVGSDRQGALEPGNPYVAGYVDAGWDLLATIAAIPQPLAHAAFREACGLPALPSRPAPRLAAAPVAEEFDGRRAVPVDLSVWTDALRFGAWNEPAAIAAVTQAAAASATAIGRYGERRLRAAGGLCIAGEVLVGYGRLGHHFWAFEQQVVVPDLVTIAKPAGNGHPVAAVITTRAIADEFSRRTDVFSSVGGSPVSCEVGLAVLDAIEQERLQENAREVGEHLVRRLGPLVGRHPLVGALHGMGLYRGLELVRDREARTPAREEAHAICGRLQELGVIVQPTGPGANVLKFKPPLCVTRDDVDFFTEALEHTLSTGW